MMMCSTNRKIQQYNVKISNTRGSFKMATTVSKVNKSVLLSVPNPRYAEKINQYTHLEGVVMDDGDTKSELPIHLILGASEYSQTKTDTRPRIGKTGEPIAELTTLGWTMMSAGKRVLHPPQACHQRGSRIHQAENRVRCVREIKREESLP